MNASVAEVRAAPALQVVRHGGVTCIGFTDFPSRLPAQASTLYSNNISKVGNLEVSRYKLSSKAPPFYSVLYASKKPPSLNALLQLQ